MSDFLQAFNFMLSNEKGLEENPNDPGGITNLGISLRFLKSLSPKKLLAYGLANPPTAEDVKALTPTKVQPIYENEFWNVAPFAQIPYQKLCNVIFDAACNVGIAQAIKFVQRAIWSAQGQEKVIPDDGILGKETLRYIKISGFNLLPAIRSERAGYYRALEIKVPNDKSFDAGWLNRAYNS